MMNIETVIHTRDTNGAKQFIEQYGHWEFLNLIYVNRAHIRAGVVDWVKSFVDVTEILLLDWPDGFVYGVSVELIEYYDVSVCGEGEGDVMRLMRFAEQLGVELQGMSDDRGYVMEMFGVLSGLIAVGAVPACMPLGARGSGSVCCKRRQR